MKPQLANGRAGQFDVLVDGELLASRSGNILTRLLGGGWPDSEAVVTALKRQLAAKA